MARKPSHNNDNLSTSALNAVRVNLAALSNPLEGLLTVLRQTEAVVNRFDVAVPLADLTLFGPLHQYAGQDDSQQSTPKSEPGPARDPMVSVTEAKRRQHANNTVQNRNQRGSGGNTGAGMRPSTAEPESVNRTTQPESFYKNTFFPFPGQGSTAERFMTPGHAGNTSKEYAERQVNVHTGSKYDHNKPHGVDADVSTTELSREVAKNQINDLADALLSTTNISGWRNNPGQSERNIPGLRDSSPKAEAVLQEALAPLLRKPGGYYENRSEKNVGAVHQSYKNTLAIIGRYATEIGKSKSRTGNNSLAKYQQGQGMSRRLATETPDINTPHTGRTKESGDGAHHAPTSQEPSLPSADSTNTLDPDELSSKINDALLEQARLNGVDLS